MRKERSQLEFPDAAWTSFDRYSRYGVLARTLRATLGPGRHHVLDVGDADGYLAVFDADLAAYSLDMAVTGPALSGQPRLVGDGRRLPFRDATFDAVVSSDALEHVPPHDRQRFVGELARVSRDLVVLAAPFDTPGVAGSEELVRRFVLLATGAPQPQLEEHRDYGLPTLPAVVDWLESAGMTVAAAGNGNLHDWVLMMLLKHQIAPRPALGPLADGYDILYNAVFSQRNDQPPHYRHVVAGRRFGTATVAVGPPAAEGAAVDPGPLLAGMVSANVTEVVRQDTVAVEAQLTDLRGEVRDGHAALVAALAAVQADGQRQGETVRRLGEAVDRVEAEIGKLGAAFGRLRHPLRTLAGRRGD